MELENGGSAFVKAGLDEISARNLRAEAVVFEAVSGRFLPQLLAWEDGNVPLLILEDLSAALWPPPFPADTQPLFDALDEIATVDPPPALPSLKDSGPGRSGPLGAGTGGPRGVSDTRGLLARVVRAFHPDPCAGGAVRHRIG